ncbi:hypothetical protein TNCV_1361691 [Trichonephila clavipes]|nr:hypothetical protein TNCV_1361691 [Trichonephila clavipes]
MKKDEIGGTGWKGWMEGNAGRVGWGEPREGGGGDGENSFGEVGTSSTSAPRDPEPPLFYYCRASMRYRVPTDLHQDLIPSFAVRIRGESVTAINISVTDEEGRNWRDRLEGVDGGKRRKG